MSAFMANENDSVKKLRILFVGNDLLGRAIATHSIWQIGYWNDVVSGGRRAIQAVQKHPYHLIFLELDMPKPDGYSTAKIIRDLEHKSRRSPSLICAIADNQSEAVRDRCLEAGICNFIKKPYYIKELRDMIRLAEAIFMQPLYTGSTDTSEQGSFYADYAAEHIAFRDLYS